MKNLNHPPHFNFMSILEAMGLSSPPFEGYYMNEDAHVRVFVAEGKVLAINELEEPAAVVACECPLTSEEIISFLKALQFFDDLSEQEYAALFQDSLVPF